MDAEGLLPLAFTLVIPFIPASKPTSRTITDKIESDNLPVRCPMIFFIADRSKIYILNSDLLIKLRYDPRYLLSSVPPITQRRFRFTAPFPAAALATLTYWTHKLELHSDSLLDLESNSREELLFMKAIKSSSVIRHPCPAFMPTNLPVVSHW